MLWAIFSILAGFLWAVVNIIDKVVLSKFVKNPLVPIFFLGIFGIISAAFIYVFNGFSYLSNVNILLALLSGIFYMSMSIFYFKALKIEEASRISPLFLISPIFIMFLAYFLLGEKLSIYGYAGTILTLTGAILISIKKFKFSLGRAFWYMMLSNISIAVSSILLKYLLGFADYWTIFSYNRIGGIFVLIPLTYFVFPDLTNSIKKHGFKFISAVSLAELTNLMAVLSITIATSLGPVTLVSVLSSLQPFFVLKIAIGLSLFTPSILKEKISKSIVLLKLIAISIMFVGVYLILR